MIGWNFYGSVMLKSDYFVESSSAAQQESMSQFMAQQSFLKYDDTTKYGHCNLAPIYNTIKLFFLIATYIEILIYVIYEIQVFVSSIRFFKLIDDIPASEQRRLPVRNGGRCNPLMRRTYKQYRDSFDYALYMNSYGHISSATENRFIREYKEKIANDKRRRRMDSVCYIVR